MKLASSLAFAILVCLAPLARAQQPHRPPMPPPDPIVQFVFPPDLVMRFASDIGLDDKQRASIKDAVVKTQAKLVDVQWEVQGESEKLARLLQANPVDEEAVLAQADKVMGYERDVKRTHLALLVRIKNLLTDQQRARLQELRRGGPQREP